MGVITAVIAYIVQSRGTSRTTADMADPHPSRVAAATIPLSAPARRPARPASRRERKSIVLTIVMVLFVLYALVPLAWLIINATKTQPDLFASFGLWFGDGFNLFQNIADTLTYRNGIFVQWFGNTLLYVVAGAGGATILATIAGYGLANTRFPGKRAVFAVILGAVAVPGPRSPCRPS